jgi:hypothetical protein
MAMVVQTIAVIEVVVVVTAFVLVSATVVVAVVCSDDNISRSGSTGNSSFSG